METRLEAVRRILDAATGDGQPGHEGKRRFWNLPRDEFVAARVYGQQVIVAGKPEESALIKSLRGVAPFDGSQFPRMPIGRPPVAAADVEFIAGWIADGCPDSDPAAGRGEAARVAAARADRGDAIVRLMRAGRADHDMAWLVEALRAALKLEFATIPPYLCARWSIVDGLDPSSLSIRDIVREEMLHMALVCNMLAALGQTPEMNTPEAVPRYPGPLPGGVRPGVVVTLSGLTRESAATFMEVEYPEGGSVARAEGEAFPTIGAFYEAIAAAFEDMRPELAADRQLEGPLGLTKLTSVAQVRAAVDLIRQQGEGTTASPEDTPGDLAHYYRFGEIYHGKKLVKDAATGEWRFAGPDVPFPRVWPMAVVPEGGYSREGVPALAWELIDRFDRSFTTMLDKLHDAWASTSQARLGESVGIMFSLRDPAEQLMKIPRTEGGGNYGPCFRIARN